MAAPFQIGNFRPQPCAVCRQAGREGALRSGTAAARGSFRADTFQLILMDSAFGSEH